MGTGLVSYSSSSALSYSYSLAGHWSVYQFVLVGLLGCWIFFIIIVISVRSGGGKWNWDLQSKTAARRGSNQRQTNAPLSKWPAVNHSTSLWNLKMKTNKSSLQDAPLFTLHNNDTMTKKANFLSCRAKVYFVILKPFWAMLSHFERGCHWNEKVGRKGDSRSRLFTLPPFSS